MKNKIIIATAFLLILFGLYGLAGSLSQSDETTEVAKVEEAKVKTWVLKSSVSKGDFVKQDLLKIRYIPESEALEYGVSEDVELDNVIGSVFRSSMPANQMLYNADIINPEDDGYIHYVIAANRVPYAIEVSPSDVIGGVISHGSMIDVVALSLPDSELASNNSLRRTMSITPVLIGVKALQIKKPISTQSDDVDNSDIQKVSVILELTRKQVAKLTVAKRISELEVHKSIGQYAPEDLQADAGDVLADFRSITEFRAGESAIK